METRRPQHFLPKTWDLPEAIRRRLGDEAGRQRLMDEEGHLLFILHEVPRPEDDEIRRPFLLWGKPDGTWKNHPGSGGFAALDGHLDSYGRAIHELDRDAESAQTPKEYFEVMKRAHPLLRATRNLLTVMECARKARPADRRLIVARDRAIDLERAADLATGDAKAGMDFSLAVSGADQARAAHEAGMEARRLNRLAAFFFPLVTMVGVFGMNPPQEVMAMPGFREVLAVGVIAGAVVFFLSLSKKKRQPSK
ncbi:hypothetical protein [Haloferula sargassicola]|uniref:CorA-like Mg2+ transporter protein n=1 Tax=Haloferula sargassicola TaxID=490096 RepID=A0ABP9US43_9BACT